MAHRESPGGVGVEEGLKSQVAALGCAAAMWAVTSPHPKYLLTSTKRSEFLNERFSIYSEKNWKRDLDFQVWSAPKWLFLVT